MGYYYVSMVLICADGSEYFETDPRYKPQDPEDLSMQRIYLRGETLHGKWHSQDFLLLDDHVCPWYGRGLPDWLNQEQREGFFGGQYVTWFTIDELMAVDWDAPFRPWPETGTRREKLGNDFVLRAAGLKEAGVVKVTLSV